MQFQASNLLLDTGNPPRRSIENHNPRRIPGCYPVNNLILAEHYVNYIHIHVEKKHIKHMFRK